MCVCVQGDVIAARSQVCLWWQQLPRPQWVDVNARNRSGASSLRDRDVNGANHWRKCVNFVCECQQRSNQVSYQVSVVIREPGGEWIFKRETTGIGCRVVLGSRGAQVPPVCESQQLELGIACPGASSWVDWLSKSSCGQPTVNMHT